MECAGRQCDPVQIPEDRQIDWLCDRLIVSGLCSLKELKDGTYGWADVWRMHDALDLKDWIEWQSHVNASAE